ncbi:thiol:disulfide interchange protein DsbA/DsbL [Roseateles sp. BYS180W]|uniref:Thiol:disulfide interchange protein DsbA n=1 Tax=Roseateles rivi TaxID=3299028 RepID=A0ABW7FTT2_9BURK
MKRREFAAGMGASALGLGLSAPVLAQRQPVEGQQFKRLATPVPTNAPGKIEVLEFFWYGCPHCYIFEPYIEDWAKKLPADVVFRKVHVAFRANVKQHQKMFYALDALGLEARARPAIFAGLQSQGLALDTPKAMADFLGPLGVDPQKFQSAFNSFGVAAKCQQAERLSEAYRIEGVPTVAIQGRFVTAPSLHQIQQQRVSEQVLAQSTLQTMDALIRQVRGK